MVYGIRIQDSIYLPVGKFLALESFLLAESQMLSPATSEIGGNGKDGDNL